MHANKREDINEILAGDICAAVGLKNVSTGDTICDEKHPIALESITFAVPVISVAVEPKTKADQEKMGMALGRSWRRKIPPSRFTPIPIADKPSSAAWASCISKSSSTA